MDIKQLLKYLTEAQIRTLTLSQAIGICSKVEAIIDVLEEEGHGDSYSYAVEEVVQEVVEMYLEEED
jgi:phosphatidylglycerophosphatase A